MSWNRIRLGDIAIFRNGINFGKESYGKGVSLIGVSDFKNRFYPDYETLDEVKESVVGVNDYLDYGDIVFVRSNGNKELVGRCMVIKTTKSKITYSGFCIRTRIKNKTEHDPIFWTYHFKNISFRKSMSGNAVGTNIQNLSQGMLSNYEAEVPDYNTQLRIASILVDYDNLIENNQKQIKLLEEAAQRLYKEWFVDLRFPGHENVEIVDGIPVEWESLEFLNIAPIITGKKDANFGSENGKYLFFTCSQQPLLAESYSYDCDAVILAGNGDFNVKLYRGKFEAYQRTYVLSPYKTEHLYLLFYTIKNRMNYLIQGASGSTIKFLTKGMIADIKVLVPTCEILNQYNEIAESLQSKLEALIYQNKLLTEARDRLLPKLMSGEIEV